jgi:hypothetical protein
MIGDHPPIIVPKGSFRKGVVQQDNKRGRSESAGQSRHGVADERAAQERSSEPILFGTIIAQGSGGAKQADSRG